MITVYGVLVRNIAPELIVIMTGIILLIIGLTAWLGWERMAVIVGALLLMLGSWSAASGRADRGR